MIGSPRTLALSRQLLFFVRDDASFMTTIKPVPYQQENPFIHNLRQGIRPAYRHPDIQAEEFQLCLKNTGSTSLSQ